MFRTYKLKQPANRHARIGAFYSALLPVVIGLMLLGGTAGSALNLEKAFLLPISIGLIFGTPIVAWLCQDAIARQERLDYWKLLEISLMRATLLQLIFGTLCIVFLYNNGSYSLFEFKSLMSAVLAVHTVLWGVITLPLSLACTVIFKLTALRPTYS